MIASRSGLKFPNIEEVGASSLNVRSDKGKSQVITHEPYTKIEVLGARGIGGNKNIKTVQAEHRAK